MLKERAKKKVQKDIDKIFKKITKNKKYFISAKDLALADALITDGFLYHQILNIMNLQRNLKFQVIYYN